MTFWETILENKVKILGGLTTLVAGLLSMIALGMFAADANSPALMDPIPLRWMTIFLSLANMLLGGGTVAAGVANTTKIRVAEAAATVAVANASTAAVIESALNTPAPGDTK